MSHSAPVRLTSPRHAAFTLALCSRLSWGFLSPSYCVPTPCTTYTSLPLPPCSYSLVLVGTVSRSFLRLGAQNAKTFLELACLEMSLFCPWLICGLARHSRLEITLLQNLGLFLHCLLTSSDVGEKSEIILTPDPLYLRCFSFSGTCRIFLLFWNFKETCLVQITFDLWCWTPSGPIQSRFMFFSSGKLFWKIFDDTFLSFFFVLS